MKVLGEISRVIKVIWRGISFSTTVLPNDSITADREITLPDVDANDTLVSKTSTDVLTNKSIDADTNSITNIDNDEIKAGAAIDATKIGSGAVDNTEYSYLDGVTSPIQGQIDDADTAISDHINDATDAHDASAISYDNTSSGLTATNAQGAIDEVEGRVDTNETNISGNTSAISNHISNPTGAHAASAISYDNVSSGLTATTTQAAIDEVEGRVDTNETNIANNASAIGNNDTDITDLQNNKADKTITITGTDGLDGGGDLSANRTLNIANLGVTTGKLAADAVDNTKLADNAVQTENILNSAVTTDKINNDAVTTDKILNANVTEAKLATDAVTTTKIQNGAVTNAKINDVAATKITGSFESISFAATNVTETLGSIPVPSTATHLNVTIANTGNLSAFTGLAAGRYFQLENASGSAMFIVDGAGIQTGTGGTLELANEASLIFYYDGTTANVMGGSGSGGGGGGITTEFYTHATLPFTLVKDVRYIVDISGGNATALMPLIDVTNAGSAIEVWPVNAGVTGNTITVSCIGDQFNDPDLGISTDNAYLLDIGRSRFVAENAGFPGYWHVGDSYWAAALEVNPGVGTVIEDTTMTSHLISAADTYQNIRSVVLTEGTWQIYAAGTFFRSTGTTGSNSTNLCIQDNLGNTMTRSLRYFNSVQEPGRSFFRPVSTQALVTVPAGASETYHMAVRADFANEVSLVGEIVTGNLTDPDNQTQFYAVRIK